MNLLHTKQLLLSPCMHALFRMWIDQMNMRQMIVSSFFLFCSCLMVIMYDDVWFDEASSRVLSAPTDSTILLNIHDQPLLRTEVYCGAARTSKRFYNVSIICNVSFQGTPGATHWYLTVNGTRTFVLDKNDPNFQLSGGLLLPILTIVSFGQDLDMAVLECNNGFISNN